MLHEIILWIDEDCNWFDLHQYKSRFLFNKYMFSIYLPYIKWTKFNAWLPKI